MTKSSVKDNAHLLRDVSENDNMIAAVVDRKFWSFLIYQIGFSPKVGTTVLSFRIKREFDFFLVSRTFW